MDGTPFGRYRLIELIGRGGMGEVWRAHDTDTDRIVAIKVLPAHFSDNEDFKHRFRREAHAAARLNTPHVIPIHNYGEIDGRLYVDMRLIEGSDLQTVLAGGPLEPARAVYIIGQVALALNAAHEVGLLHRDVKPSNVLLDRHDFAYLIDFGISRAADETRLTKSGNTIGTFQYIAPERLGTSQEDARADIYSLACVLYECLTGHPPFDEASMAQLVAAHLNTPPPQPSTTQPNVPPQVDPVIATGMAKDPNQRYATTVQLADAARDAITVPLPAPGPAIPVHPTSQPDLRVAGLIHGQNIQLAATGTAPVWQPPPGSPPLWVQPSRKRPIWRRPGIVIPALLAIVLLIGGGVFAAVKVSQGHENTPAASAPPPTAPTAAPNTGPFTGNFTANFGPALDVAGKPVVGQSRAYKETWRLRSACGASGCVATAFPGAAFPAKEVVFDDVGGRWLAVATSTTKCGNLYGEEFDVVSLQPRPDGTMSGEWEQANSRGCYSKRTVTFTRTGDTDVSLLADPPAQPPRVVSPAEALHGRYHDTTTYAVDGRTSESDNAVRTDCLRSGDRCLSFFLSPDVSQPLLFGNGKWILDQEGDAPCSAGGTQHIKDNAEYPLPAPAQDPIPLLTGHGHTVGTGTACAINSDFDQKFVRTGD